MSLFTPRTGILGGTLIGLSASTLLVGNGDILGFSGMISSIGLNVKESLYSVSSHWKLVWLSTFMLTVNFYINHVEDATRDHRLETSGQVPIASTVAHAIGGFLVGLGTKLANGCTSGHGVCGMARQSKRSFVAVPIFMGTSMVTAAMINFKGAPWHAALGFLRTDVLHLYSKTLGTLVTAGVVSLGLLRQYPKDEKVKVKRNEEQKVFGAMISAVMSALGLAISGMTKKSKVNDFLDICALCRSQGGAIMDPTLMAVMGSAMMASWAGYNFVPGSWLRISSRRSLSQPLIGGDNTFSVPTSTMVDTQLVLGSALFGMGWGMTGLCPGPALYQAAAGMSDVILAWFPFFFLGSWVGQQIKDRPYVPPPPEEKKSK